MLELCRDPDLAQESLGADRGRELRPQHLDGDRPVVLEILGQKDGGHPALAELALEAVAVGESRCEARGRCRHLSPSVAGHLLITVSGTRLRLSSCRMSRRPACAS